MPRITHNLTSVSPITPTHWRSTHRTHTQPDRHVHIPIRGMTFSNEKPHSEHGFCRQNVALCRINLAWCPNQTRATALIEPMKLHGLGRMWLRAGSVRPNGKINYDHIPCCRLECFVPNQYGLTPKSTTRYGTLNL